MKLKSSGKKVEVSVNLLFIHLENIIVTDMQMHTFIAATSKKIYINPTISPRKLHLLTFVVVRDVSRHGHDRSHEAADKTASKTEAEDALKVAQPLSPPAFLKSQRRKLSKPKKRIPSTPSRIVALVHGCHLKYMLVI